MEQANLEPQIQNPDFFFFLFPNCNSKHHYSWNIPEKKVKYCSCGNAFFSQILNPSSINWHVYVQDSLCNNFILSTLSASNLTKMWKIDNTSNATITATVVAIGTRTNIEEERTVCCVRCIIYFPHFGKIWCWTLNSSLYKSQNIRE